MRKMAYILLLTASLLMAMDAGNAAYVNHKIEIDTLWRPYWIINNGNIVILKNQYGQLTPKWIKHIAAPSQSVIFNFNQTAQSIAGTVDVSGIPTGTGSTLTTDPVTGWSIKDTTGSGRSSWRQFGGANNYSTGATVNDGGGFALGQGVSTDLWVSLAWGRTGTPATVSLDPWLVVNNLKPSSSYTLSFLMSLKSTSGAPTNDTMFLGYNSAAIIDTILPATINDNTSKLTVRSVQSSSGGSITIYTNATAGGNTSYNLINGLKIEEVQ